MKNNMAIRPHVLWECFGVSRPKNGGDIGFGASPERQLTCCVMAKPMTGSPSGMSQVTRAEFALTAVMLALTGGDKLSANRGKDEKGACLKS